jgi:hypothetical protein
MPEEHLLGVNGEALPMTRKRPLRIPRTLSASMTYAELEKWFEAEFERARRQNERETKARNEKTEIDKEGTTS